MSALKESNSPFEDKNHDTLIHNLRLLMRKRDINDAELSRRTDIPQATIHKLLSGKTTDPRISTLNILANYFGLSVDALYSNSLSENETQVPEARAVPIISWEECVKNDPTTNLTPNNWNKWVIIEKSENKNIYGLITKPSMEPRFPRGLLLIVDAQIRPSDGDFVVVQYPQTPEATLRELSIDGPHRFLHSINEGSDSDKLDDTIKIIATVIQSRFSY